MNKNYHTHTFRCGHATGDEEEMVLGAIEKNFKVLGMSDHIPLPYFRLHLMKGIPYMRSFESFKKIVKWTIAGGVGTRMAYSSKANHLKIMNHLKEKYKDQIKIHIGFEAEYFEEYLDYYQSLLDNKEVEYLLLGNHFHGACCNEKYNGYALDTKALADYGRTSCLAMRTGLFSYFCHPDLFMAQTPEFSDICYKISRDICLCALENNVPLEINGGGFRRGKQKIGNTIRYPYPHDEFWKIASDLQVPVILGLDSHSPSEFTKEECETMEEYAKKMELNVVESFEFKKGK